jgi:hypothetical protein
MPITGPLATAATIVPKSPEPNAARSTST